MEVKLAYLAGLIDADGCISLNKTEGDRRTPCLSFVNTSEELIKLFQDELGGHVHIKPHKHPQKPVYEVQIRKPETLIKALDKIEPFLIYKKPKLLLAKEYAFSILKHKYQNRTELILKEREDIYNKWKLL